ncbi:mechanosensitive ion channel family protein [Novosphingobium sp. Gsoil 351]|uniref:mechanosensitive ion channel family protein n=1 Tax=Novosphingobium sp. Gsoil 351 TaxID=2675225 RepID=UPI0012B4A022|nr:mechanosensitive ion channel domain-containing protein [Novosphingobium sp. Gsoil 351]QGN53802.1 mechanosensitive ion channel [Novosphingobium sp. Gsoil 351]
MTELDTLYFDTIAWFSSHALRIALAIGIGALLVLLFTGLKHLLLRGAARLGGDGSWPALIAAVIRKTRLWFLIALAARLVQGYANAPEMVGRTIGFVFIVAATFQAAIWARTFVLGLIEHRAGQNGQDSGLASAMAIIRLLVSFAVFAIALIFVLDNLGVNVTGLVAGLGVGGIAIGLAAQGIFGDLFAALSILFDKPFRVGDTIVYQGKEGPITGHVERIGLKSTRIRALTGELRIIANAKLLEQELTNMAGQRFFRMQIAVGVVYHTPPELAEAIPAIMQQTVEAAGQTFVRANFAAFGPSSLDYQLVFEAEVGDLPEAKAAYQAVALGLLRAFRERGIEFAYPTQTTYTAAPDGTMIMPYAGPPAAPGKSSEASP